VLQASPLHFVAAPLRPEFTRNYSNRFINKKTSKPWSSTLSFDEKEWEVRFHGERDGPLDALEVIALLKMCSSDNDNPAFEKPKGVLSD